MWRSYASQSRLVWRRLGAYSEARFRKGSGVLHDDLLVAMELPGPGGPFHFPGGAA